MNQLSKIFLTQPANLLAPQLLGKILTVKTPEGLLSGMIVETEAYLQDEPSCHAYVGKTERNKMMFALGGITYVYQIYGIHFCFNVVSGQENQGEAVLIRALEPLEGITQMQKNRQVEKLKNLTNGPGKLCQALGINRDLNGEDLLNSNNIFLQEGSAITSEIITTTRIGITKAVDLPLRFYIKDNIFVSKF